MDRSPFPHVCWQKWRVQREISLPKIYISEDIFLQSSSRPVCKARQNLTRSCACKYILAAHRKNYEQQHLNNERQQQFHSYFGLYASIEYIAIDNKMNLNSSAYDVHILACTIAMCKKNWPAEVKNFAIWPVQVKTFQGFRRVFGSTLGPCI